MSLQHRPSPEDEHLAEQERLLADLAEQLAAREEEFAEHGSAFARFRDRFLRRFAPLYAELDRLEAEVARLVAEGEGTDEAQRRAEAAEERARESERAAHDEELLGEAQAEREPPSEDLKSLFRRAAKSVHPDLATDEGEKARRHDLMAALNAAFAARDADAIRSILEGERVRPEAVRVDDTASRLVRVIRRIAQVRRRIAELEAMTADLRADPLYSLFDAVRSSAEDDPLADDEATLRRRIASARTRLAALQGRA